MAEDVFDKFDYALFLGQDLSSKELRRHVLEVCCAARVLAIEIAVIGKELAGGDPP